MKLLASRFARILNSVWRAIILGFSKLFWGQPIIVWLFTLATALSFALEMSLPTGASQTSFNGEFVATVTVWALTVLAGVLSARSSSRAALDSTLAARAGAARATATALLLWAVFATIFWWMLRDQLGADHFLRGLSAILLLTPSFAIYQVFLQRGLRDAGYETDVVLLNKTGTLTAGARTLSFVQVAVGSPLQTQAQILALAVGLESAQSGDLSKAIRDRVKRRGIKPVELKDVMSIPGLGMSARFEGSRLVLGGPDQLVAHNAEIDVVDLVRADQANSEGQTVLYLLLDGVLCGYLGFADEVRSELKFFVQLLQYRRKRVVVYSSDAHETTKYFATQLGCTEFYGEVLPSGYEPLLQKIRSDGSRVLESNDVYNTALQVERAVRDRRLQNLSLGFTLTLAALALFVGVANLGTGVASILVPAVCSAISLLVGQIIYAISRRIWEILPKTILTGQESIGSEDER